MTERKVMGKRVPRVDALDKVTGRAVFGADFHIPTALWGKVLRSPYAHARIKRLDVSRALARDGVKAIITGEDIPKLGPVSAALTPGTGISATAVVAGLMAREKATYAGQPVAAVAAVDLDTAEEALRLIEVEYEELPVVEDVLDAMKENAPLVQPDLKTETLGKPPTGPSNIAAHIEMGRGDVKAGFAQAAVVLENTFRTQMVHQGYIEPHAATARVNPNGTVTVWTSSQGSFAFRMQLAAVLNLPLGKIRVIPLEVGGAFGGKTIILLEPLCILLARKAGRPVKMVMTREEELRASRPGSPSVITIKTGATKEGLLTAVEARLIFDSGAAPGSPEGGGVNTGLAPYKVPNLKVEGYGVLTNKPPVGAYRAPGATQAAFAVESQMDLMAQALGLDPLEFRLKNIAGEGDPLPDDTKLDRVGFRQALERMAQHPAWKSPLGGPHPSTGSGQRRGRGLACGYWTGATGTSSCHLVVNADGSLCLVVGSVDLTGTRTSLAQVVAEEFGVPPEQVAVTTGDTDTVGFTDVSAGSRITYTMSAAVQRACQDAKAQLARGAAARLQARPEDIEYVEGQFRVKGSPDKSMPLLMAARNSMRAGDGPVTGRGAVTRLKSAPSFAVHAVDLEVDPETGKVKLLAYTAIQDVGYAINPTLVEGQIQGGVAQGIGWALSEGYRFDHGVLANATLLDYRQPTAADVPPINTVLVEVAAPDGPYGVRGVGEAPIVPPPAAIANALHRALGVRLKELPMTPEAVFWAAQAAGK
ncbi:MAG: xanthine dehydrogenase family protein molybdopterin-binding subunit [Chloroflexota bacterium]|nr:xanthine dehydrogenase family protein molybdopterin-binding subunit [Chloroflexota bacterium]